MLIGEQGLTICNNNQTLYTIKIKNTIEQLKANDKDPMAVSSEFNIANIFWQIKLWLCYKHIHFELIRKNKSPYYYIPVNTCLRVIPVSDFG